MSAPGEPTPLLACHDLVRDLGDGARTRALDGVSLSVAAGEFLTLTGRSGSGKSTLLYLLGALDRPTAGQVLIEGVDASALGDDARAELRRRRLGFVFQFHFLLPEFSALENVMLPLLRAGARREDARVRGASLLAEVGLGHLAARRPSELSGGEQQRVSIARALANRPRIVLADEATGNLDSANARIVMDLFADLVARGTTVVLVTHDPRFASEGTRRIVLEDGRVIA